jgi:iron(III) transport system permease protein
VVRRESIGPADNTRHADCPRENLAPLIRFGLISSWLLCFMIFVREYSTGVYLQGPGTEVLGPVIVSLFGGGSLELGRRCRWSMSSWWPWA